MKTVFTGLFFLLILPAICVADVLGTWKLHGSLTLIEDAHRIRPAFGYDLGNAATARILFDDHWIDSTSVGQELVATAYTDTDFAGLAALMADGKPDFLCGGSCEQIECGAICGAESLLFALPSVDFLPSTIESIHLHVETLSFFVDAYGNQIADYWFGFAIEGTHSVAVTPTSWGRLRAKYR